MSEELIMGGGVSYNTTINTRIINKNDTSENWETASFTPYKGELIVYNDDIQKIKIGNGEDSVNELPFIGSDYIVEAGTEEAPIVLDTDNSITWHWRRWASGIVEIWGRSDTYSETLYAQGNGYISDRRFFRFPLGLIKSGTSPIVNITLQQVNYGQPWVSVADCGSSGCAAGLCCFITGPCTARYHIRAIGEWGGIRAKVISYTDGEYTTTDDVITLKTNKVSRNLLNLGIGKHSGRADISNIEENKITVKQSTSLTWQSCNIPVLEGIVGKTVTISGKISTSGENSGALRLMWVAKSGLATGNYLLTEYISSTTEKSVSVSGEIPSQPSEEYNTLCLMLYSNVNGSIENNVEYSVAYSNIQIEIGDEQTDYEPWTGVTKLDDTFTTDGKQVYYSSDPDVGYCFFTFI